jgi:hypothetical protein
MKIEFTNFNTYKNVAFCWFSCGYVYPNKFAYPFNSVNFLYLVIFNQAMVIYL